MRHEHSSSRDRRRRGGGLRALIETRCFSPFALNDVGDGGSVAGRRSTYLKLPPQLIKLSIVKLDGSVFDVHIAKDGSVAALKRAVEEVFTMSPQEGQSRISWSHVWGHFCLCYQEHKLVEDKASIRSLGINDGDQLYFVRHLSIHRSPLNRRSKSQSFDNYPESQTKSNTNQNNADDIPESCYPGAQDELPVSEFRAAHFFRGWLSGSGLRGVSRKGSETWNRASRFSLERFGGRRTKMIQL